MIASYDKYDKNIYILKINIDLPIRRKVLKFTNFLCGNVDVLHIQTFLLNHYLLLKNALKQVP